jgi:hypothetical protein
MTTNETLPQANQDSGLDICSPPEQIVEHLATLPVKDGSLIRRRLAQDALELHTVALTYSLETGEAEEIPAAASWPRIVGPDVIATMALARRIAGRMLATHPTDPAKCLIVSRKPDILGKT